MKITKTNLRRIIKESLLIKEMATPVLDREAAYSKGLFGDSASVAVGKDNEIVVDTGQIEVAEDMRDWWVKIWPKGLIKGNGIIHTGIYK